MGIEPVRIGKLISEIITKSGTHVKKSMVSAEQILMDGYAMPKGTQLQLKEIVYGNKAPLRQFGVDKVNIFTNPADPSYKRIEWCVGDKILAGIEQFMGLECQFSRGLKDGINNYGKGKNFFLDLLDKLKATKRLPNKNSKNAGITLPKKEQTMIQGEYAAENIPNGKKLEIPTTTTTKKIEDIDDVVIDDSYISSAPKEILIVPKDKKPLFTKPNYDDVVID